MMLICLNIHVDLIILFDDFILVVMFIILIVWRTIIHLKLHIFLQLFLVMFSHLFIPVHLSLLLRVYLLFSRFLRYLFLTILSFKFLLHFLRIVRRSLLLISLHIDRPAFRPDYILNFNLLVVKFLFISLNCLIFKWFNSLFQLNIILSHSSSWPANLSFNFWILVIFLF